MKVGRNDACHCGSGRKFKHCHGAPGAANARRPVIDNRQAAAALVQQALQQHQSGNLENARKLYAQVLKLEPLHSDAIHFLGYISYQEGDLEAALQAMRHSIELNPGASQYHGNLGIVLMRLERFEEATTELELSIRLEPKNAESHNNLGSVCQLRGQYQRARDFYERAILLVPGFASAMNNLGTTLVEMRDFEQAAKLHERVLALDPANADAHFFLAFARLNQGRLHEGWKEYAWRLDVRLNPLHRVTLRPFPSPVWQGQKLAGKTLLVTAEQGVGDQIWASGMFDELPQFMQENSRVIVECAPKLLPLFRRSFAWAEVAPRTNPPDPKCLLNVDCKISFGSLAAITRPELASFPRREASAGAYLIADPVREKFWKERMAGGDLKVGICWRSNNLSGERALKCTRLLQWSQLLRTKGVQFVNLQYDECEAELAEAETAYGIRIARYPEVDMFNDLDEVAALMRGLGLVISAPTAVAILSGALGVPTWELNSGTEWQCFGQVSNPMYPAMRNYVKRWDQPWEETLGSVAGDLKAKLLRRETMQSSSERA